MKGLSDASSDILRLQFTEPQARLLDQVSKQTAMVGGPDAGGAAAMAACHAKKLKQSLSIEQLEIIEHFANGNTAAVEFVEMRPLQFDPLPKYLATMKEIISDATTLYMASRSQILLSLVGYRTFAFDIDNDGMQVRLVGNFKGGGEHLLREEYETEDIELSSHAGIRLGPHTEPPYNCSVQSENGHSPAPSALILTARWNPLDEPTTLVPLRRAVEKLSGLEALALSSKSFCFTRSDCFIKDESQSAQAGSILQYDQRGGFNVRYSSYRHSLNNDTNQSVREAYHSFQRLLEETTSYQFSLHSDSALLINNSQALHAREMIKDNRRLLIRLFGYSPEAQPIVLQQDPLIVRG